MDFKAYLAISLVVFNYLTPWLLKPSGMSAYMLPSVTWLLVFSLLYREVWSDRGFTKRLMWLMPFAVALRVGIDIGTGVIVGFGGNILSRDGYLILTNMLTVIPYILGLESFRFYLIKRTGKTWVNVLLIATLITGLSFPPIRYLTLTSLNRSVNFILRRFIPDLATNTFITQVAVWGGVKPAVLYSTLTNTYIYITPILPNTPWYLEPLISLVIPLSQLVLIGSFINIRSFETPKWRKPNKLAKGFTAALVAVAVVMLLIIAMGGRFMTVVSGSMEPGIRVGDIAIVYPSNNLSVGDVIAFRGPQSPVLHRIISITSGSNGTVIQTKGDANTAPDPFTIPSSAVIGKLIYVIPLLGLPIVYGTEVLGGFLNFATSLVILIFFLQFFTLSNRKGGNHE
jgi:signal peptidase I